MWLRNYLFLFQYLIYSNIISKEYASAKPLIGPNVREAGSDEYPYITAILRRNVNVVPERDLICTGTLITDLNVLTSDHCMEDEPFNGVMIVIGSIDLFANSKYYPAWWIGFNQWSIMRNWDNNFPTNDICMLRLTSPVTGNPVPLAELSFQPYRRLKNKVVYAPGWGRINNGTYPRILQTVRLNILPNEECAAQAYAISGQEFAVDDNLLCSKANPYALLMPGDSGGPVVQSGKVIGISIGTCPLPDDAAAMNLNRLNLLINIQFYMNYIDDVIVNF